MVSGSKRVEMGRSGQCDSASFDGDTRKETRASGGSVAFLVTPTCAHGVSKSSRDFVRSISAMRRVSLATYTNAPWRRNHVLGRLAFEYESTAYLRDLHRAAVSAARGCVTSHFYVR